MDNLFPKIPINKALFVCAVCLLSLFPIIKAGSRPQPLPNNQSLFTLVFRECSNTSLSTTSTYAPNSTYQTNLNTLLSNLNHSSRSNNASNGFYKSKAGSSPPNVAYGLFLCRGDVSAAVCRECVAFATGVVLTQCPGSKQVTIWCDKCMLRYSNASLTPSIFTAPEFGAARMTAIMTAVQNVSNVTRLNEVLEEVMNNIIDRASRDDSGKKYATAKVNYSSTELVYVLAQCTPDLSDSQCSICLGNCISKFRSCCDAKKGGRVLFRSCNVRYEMYPFYGDSFGAVPLPHSLVVPPSPPPTTTTTSSPGKKGNMIAIGVSVSASVVLLLLLGSGIYYQRRKKRIAKEEKENSSEVQLLDLAQGRIVDDYNTENLQGEKPAKSQDFPSIQLDLILEATKQFSEENKLGEGYITRWQGNCSKEALKKFRPRTSRVQE